MNKMRMAKSLLKWLISSWRQDKGSPYLIKILSIYNDQENSELMVKFKYRDNRIAGIEKVNIFINSPLIYFVHPKQLFLLGADCKDLQFKNLPRAESIRSTQFISRFKRIFYRS